MRGEGQEFGIVERPFVAMPQDHDLQVVVQAGAGHAAQVRKGADVFAEGGRQVLRLDEAQVLPARVTQHVAEEVDAAAAFVGEVDVVGAVIHLGLLPRQRLEADHRFAERCRPQFQDPLPNDGAAAAKTLGPQLLEDARDRDVGIALEQLLDRVVEGIDLARPPLRYGQSSGRFRTGTLGFPASDDALHRLACHPQVPSDASQRGSALPPPDDLVAQFFVHADSSRSSAGHRSSTRSAKLRAVAGQAYELRGQQPTILPFQLGQSGMALPVLQAAQQIEQKAELSGQPVPGGTQTGIAHRRGHAGRL